MYRLNYQYTHDIDWFCRINDVPVHLASNGGHLPNDSYTIDQLVMLQHQVANLGLKYQCEVNIQYLNSYLSQGDYYENMENVTDEVFRMMIPEWFQISQDIRVLSRPMLTYCWSFTEMARRGFLSFDRNEMTEHDNTYHLVAWPKGYDIVNIMKSESVYESLKAYSTCNFPICHESKGTDLPDYIRFDMSSIPQRFQVKK